MDRLGKHEDVGRNLLHLEIANVWHNRANLLQQ
jgi:hypothetical protein